jgi:hypothetical protein
MTQPEQQTDQAMLDTAEQLTCLLPIDVTIRSIESVGGYFILLSSKGYPRYCFVFANDKKRTTYRALIDIAKSIGLCGHPYIYYGVNAGHVVATYQAGMAVDRLNNED